MSNDYYENECYEHPIGIEHYDLYEETYHTSVTVMDLSAASSTLCACGTGAVWKKKGVFDANVPAVRELYGMF